MIPYVMINLDKPRKLRFGMGAIFEFEKITNKKITEINDDMDFKTCVDILWIMFKQDDPDLTWDQTVKMIDECGDSLNLADIMKKITEAFSAAFGVDDKLPNAETPVATSQSI